MLNYMFTLRSFQGTNKQFSLILNLPNHPSGSSQGMSIVFLVRDTHHYIVDTKVRMMFVEISQCNIVNIFFTALPSLN